MRQAVGQLGRIWVAIFAAYALLLQTIAPLGAAPMGPYQPDVAGMLCSNAVAAATDSGDGSAGDPMSHALCCILCSVGAAVAPPVSAGAIDAPVAAVMPVAYAGRDTDVVALPERGRVRPRAPPQV